MSESFSKADVAAHSKPDSLWIIVDEDVYDLTKFQDEHPGGKKSASRHRPVPISPLPADSPSSPAARCRQGRLKAVLEVPQ